MFIFNNKNRIKLLFALLEVLIIILIISFLFDNLPTSGVWEWLFFSLAMLWILPLLTIKFFFREEGSVYEIKMFSQKKDWIMSMVIWLVSMGIIAIMIMKTENGGRVWEEGKVRLLLMIDFLLMPLVVFTQEFFFRGFLQRILLDNLNRWLAILIQAIFFSVFLWLIDSSEGVFNLVYWAVVLLGSVFLGWLVNVSKSILFSTIIHWLVLLTVDIYFIYKLGAFLLRF